MGGCFHHKVKTEHNGLCSDDDVFSQPTFEILLTFFKKSVANSGNTIYNIVNRHLISTYNPTQKGRVFMNKYLSLPENLKKEREKRYLSLAALAELSGISKSSLQRYERGISRIPIKAVVEIERALGLKSGYFLDWSEDKDTSAPVISCFQKSVPLLREEKSFLPTDIDADFCVICPDDSMQGARIKGGDYVFVKDTRDVSDGSVAVLDIKGALKIRYLSKADGYIQLTATDSKTPPIVIKETSSDYKILGKVVAFLSVL